MIIAIVREINESIKLLIRGYKFSNIFDFQKQNFIALNYADSHHRYTKIKQFSLPINL